MLLIIYAVCALAAFGLALLHPPALPRYWLLVAIAAVPQLGSVLGIWIPGMFLVSVGAIFVWCLCNRNVAGVLLMALGVMLNLLPMALHGGAMPVHVDILAQLGYIMAPGTLLMASKDIVVKTSALWLLSDWLVLRSQLVTLIASPGDLVVFAGIVWWLLLSRPAERERPVLTLRAAPAMLERRSALLPGQSARPALTRLALLAAANPDVAESLMRNPLDAAGAHPHYTVYLDARDQATLAAIRARTNNVGEFLNDLANVVDGGSYR